MRFDRELDSKMDSKPAREPLFLKGSFTVHFAVHLMAISNITRTDSRKERRLWLQHWAYRR